MKCLNLESSTGVIGAPPGPEDLVGERFVDDSDSRLSADSNADHGRHVLQQVLGVLLRRVQRVDPHVDLAINFNKHLIGQLFQKAGLFYKSKKSEVKYFSFFKHSSYKRVWLKWYLIDRQNQIVAVWNSVVNVNVLNSGGFKSRLKWW